MTAVENDGRGLVAALTTAGFTVAGRGRGYVRMGWPGSRPGHGGLMVPVDDTAPEYRELLEGVKATLLAEARRGEAARYALDMHAMEAAG